MVDGLGLTPTRGDGASWVGLAEGVKGLASRRMGVRPLVFMAYDEFCSEVYRYHC